MLNVIQVAQQLLEENIFYCTIDLNSNWAQYLPSRLPCGIYFWMASNLSPQFLLSILRPSWALSLTEGGTVTLMFFPDTNFVVLSG